MVVGDVADVGDADVHAQQHDTAINAITTRTAPRCLVGGEDRGEKWWSVCAAAAAAAACLALASDCDEHVGCDTNVRIGAGAS